jgi:hypothetical protein
MAAIPPSIDAHSPPLSRTEIQDILTSARRILEARAASDPSLVVRVRDDHHGVAVDVYSNAKDEDRSTFPIGLSGVLVDASFYPEEQSWWIRRGPNKTRIALYARRDFDVVRTVNDLADALGLPEKLADNAFEMAEKAT